MAEAVVATVGASMIPVLLKPMIDKAKTVVVDRCDFVLDIKKEIEELHDTLEVIMGILPEAEEMQVVNIQIRPWLRRLVDIGYEARDVLDELVTISASTSAAKRTTTSVKYTSLPFYLLRRRLSNEIKNVRTRLDELEKQTKINEQFKSLGGGSKSIPVRGRSETSPFLDKQRALFVGREVEKEGIMEKLLNQNDNRVQLIPILGMGGVGKTTLAQEVYNDERVTEEEYPAINRRWLFVGEKKFDAKEIISKIIDRSGEIKARYHREFIEKFKGERFLIVLDDIWSIDNNEWKLFWNPLTNVGKGGVIIITTRTSDVITAIGTPLPEDLFPLSNEDCWQIFESHAFVDRHSCSDLEKKKCIGKQIVEKLKGLPLAVEVVGRSLSNEPDVQIWRNFLEAHKWKLRTRDDDVMAALRWSYNRLPPHLKQCFTYCSLFPKDHIFDKKMLVKMWMAHGFIQSVEGGGERLEDTGALYFKQLVNASLFQCVDGRYVMHDMIHDLSMLVSNEEFLRTDGLLLDVGQLEKVRHISFHLDYFWENLSLRKPKRSTLKRLLTLYTLYDWNSSHIPETSIAHITPSFCKNVIQGIFKQLKSIRVLVLISDKITYIPECISELIHLRYLDIGNTVVDRIPDTFCDLYNLQTLVARVGYLVVTVLPKNIMNMVNLRHLRACLLTCKGVRNLTSLQELYSISVSKGDKISELGNIRQLHGKLTIKCLENVTSEEDAAQAMMQEKSYIDELRLEFTEGLGDTDAQTKVLDALQCPPNLRYLEICGYNGLTSPSWMVDGKLIRNLQSLRLSNCHRLESLPPLGQLNCLKDLQFDDMRAIKKLGEEFYGNQINEKVFFPSLETLKLECMENLKEWDDIVIEDTSVMLFPCLEWLFIFLCPKLVSALPHVKICTPHMDIKDPSRNVANVMKSLSTLEISSCDGLVVLELDILVSLKHLKISDCFNLTRITYAVMLLETLVIFKCHNLESLPPDIHNLSSLKKLWLHCCRQLQALPVDGLPLSLKLLVITECPLLYERCQMESGLDWQKIKHIPEREIELSITSLTRFGLERRFHLRR